VLILKQSTAVDVLIGPFVDVTDGITGETGESPSVKLSKNGQALGAKNDATTPVSDADGYYNCELDVTDTDTVGTMVLTVAATATAAPVRHEMQVVEELVYVDLYAASASGISDIKAETVLILADTAEIGAAGIGLTNVKLPEDGLDLILKGSTHTLAVADAVWDEVLTGGTHNVTNSAGKRLRTIDAAFEVLSGIADAGTSTTITFEAGASATNEIYAGDRVVITAGTGVSEHGLILSYVGSTRVATMSKAWTVTPDNTSEYTVVPADCDVELWNDNTVTGDGDWAAQKAETVLILADTAAMQPEVAKFVFTNANELDVNTKSINDAAVVGDGNATPWDGA
jgi:hypothetical protein